VTRWVRFSLVDHRLFAAHPVTALITHFGGRDDEASLFEKEVVLVHPILTAFGGDRCRGTTDRPMIRAAWRPRAEEPPRNTSMCPPGY
jgi:hypothetical protein